MVELSDFVNEGKAAEFEADEENNPAGNFHGYYFKQTKDIDLSDITNWDPIGYSGGEDKYFSGNYDGGGYKISNATSTGKNDSGEEGYGSYATAGIFGWVYQGSISNLKVVNADFSATGEDQYSYVGGIASVVYDSTINNCFVTDSTFEAKRNDPLIDNNACAGGIAGISQGGTFTKCASARNKIKSKTYSGGFVGEIDEDPSFTTSFTNCYVAECKVNSLSKTSSQCGGFVGEVSGGNLTIKNGFVYNTAIESPANKGVFAGHLYNASSLINATNSFYGECGEVTENAGGANKKTKEEFGDNTVATVLSDPYKQGPSYPVFGDEPADYSKVDEAIAKANALNKSDYKDFSAVDAAIDAVVSDKNITEQKAVDAMAQAIEDALNELEKKTSSDPQKTPGSAKDTISGNNAGLLNLKAKAGKNNIKITWKKVPEASKYVVYGTKCNAGSKHYKFRKLKTTKKLSYTQKKLKKGTYYKYFVYAVNAKGKKITASKRVHAVTAGGRYGNPKAVKVQNTAKIKNLKIGKRVRIKAVQIDSKKKTKRHCGLRYDSSNKAVATVNSKGVISAKKKGKAAVYVYAQNGIYKKITVTVR